VGQFFHRTGSLDQQIKQFQAMQIGQGRADVGKEVIELFFVGSLLFYILPHPMIFSGQSRTVFKYSMNHLNTITK
jgi:hypothetical protein